MQSIQHCPHCDGRLERSHVVTSLLVCFDCDYPYELRDGELYELTDDEVKQLVWQRFAEQISNVAQTDDDILICPQCGCRNDINKLPSRAWVCARCKQHEFSDPKAIKPVTSLVEGARHAVDIFDADNPIAREIASRFTIGDLIVDSYSYRCRLGVHCAWCQQDKEEAPTLLQQKLTI